MDAKIENLIKNGTPAELSELKAKAVAAGGKSGEEIVAAVNSELAKRAAATPAKVKVRALQFVTVDGVPFQKGQEGEITARQYAALAWNFAKLAACVALLLLLGLGTASAQTYKVTVITTNQAVAGGSTNYSAAALTNVLHTAATTTAMMGPTNTVTKWEEVALALGVTGMESGTTSNVVVKIVRGLDGTTWETTPQITWTFPLNGVTAVVAVTNLDRTVLGSYGYWKVGSMATTSLADVTNVWLRIGTKPVRMGP